MSDQEEQLDVWGIVESTEESDDAIDIINIPVPSDTLEESELTEENGSEEEQFTTGHATSKDQSYQSATSPESNEEELVVETISPRQASHTLKLEEEQHAMQPDEQNLSDENLAFLYKIKAIKESLQISIKDPSATGKILRNNETLIQHGIKPQESVQLELSSLNPDLYPIKRIVTLNDVSRIITVIVQTGIDQFQEVLVEIVKSDFHKPFIGGFRHRITGIEYHNAGTQTVPKKIPEKLNLFCRDTQTVYQRKKIQQTTNTTSTQMTKIGLYVSNMTDKLVSPGKYFSAAEYHTQRLKAIIVIQTYYRRWHAKIFTEDLRRQKKLRLEWEAEEEIRKVTEKEEWMQLDYYRRHNPKTKEDFELLYNALELWRQEELTRINQCLTGAERKAALCELLEKETQIIASIGRHRHIARMESQEEVIQAFLDKCSSPKMWRRPDGKLIEMDTQFTIRARELQNIYKCIRLQNISQDERLDILLTLKHTVKEHECELTQEILELIDREVDLMMRGVKPQNLEGLRKRITTLFFHYIKTPLFNPEAARYLKVPQDPLKFYKKIYFCRSCQLYLPSTEFAVSSISRHVFKCRHCVNLENEAQRRESFLKYKCLLQRLHSSEANYDDGAQIAFLMQLQDIQYLIENIWAPQSVLSAWGDLNELVMVRWDKAFEWSPWNCILLTKDEAAAHLKLESIEKGYGLVFIHKIKHKHILAKNYFSQIPVLASFILDGGEMEEIKSKYHTDTAPKIIEVQRPCP
ncbi:IQ and ubiquitin-like domain-containing protein isoform X2 [Heterocephalus glaber]|uniref:IQ and ubiquitin-like domain-containing protein isoform X2 n=1 Tax=Heterocephalus glaber TaxID=10181 RepID=A0AAX6RA56_HETGA|nr:IQ and ubiquitin-like domain-containing protein isoform X2 [Heterocephalus glaber]